MNEQELLDRIACDPRIMVGKPVISGSRLTVEFILNLLAHGMTTSDILTEYDGISADDIQACLLFAKKSVADMTFMPVVAEMK